jgi:hypothetical protein
MESVKELRQEIDDVDKHANRCIEAQKATPGDGKTEAA